MKNRGQHHSIKLLLLRLIFFRLYLPLLVLGVVTVLGAGYLGVRNQIDKQLQVTRTMAQLVEYHLDQGERILDAVARSIDGLDVDHAQVFIRSTWEAYRYFETLYYLDTQDRVSIMAPADPRYTGLDLSNLPDIRNHRMAGQITISRPYISVRTGEPTVLLIRNLPRAGRIVGELKLGIFQQEIADSSERSAKDMLFIADQQGTLLAHPTVDWVRQQFNISNLKLFQRAIGMGKTITHFYRYDGAYMIGTLNKIPRTGWAVVDQIALAELGQGLVWLLTEIVFFSLLIWAVLWLAIHRQLRLRVVMPLENLSRKTEELAEGRYLEKVDSSSSQSSFLELDQLATDFSRMSIRLQERSQALQESELRYRGLFDQMPIGLFRVDDEGRFVDVNPAFIAMLGYSDRKNLLQQNIWEVLLRRKARREGRQSIGEGLDITHLEVRYRRPDGNRIWLLIQGRCSRDPKTGECYCDGSIQNITERKRVVTALEASSRLLEVKVYERTRELKQANEELAALLEHLRATQNLLVRNEKFAALGALVAGISHELGTPIGNCMMLASTLDDRMKEFGQETESGVRRSSLNRFFDEMSSGFDSLLRNLYRAGELVNNFKEVSVDQSSSRRRGFSLRKIVHEIEITQRPTLDRGGCIFYSDIPESIELDSYPGPLGQVLINLISNAVVHGLDDRKGGEIHVSAELHDEGRVLLRIADNGVGIPPENLPKIFDPFFTTKLGHGGSGLGLHIVYNLVTGILGGTIQVESIPGQGTSFLLDLPLIAPSCE